MQMEMSEEVKENNTTDCFYIYMWMYIWLDGENVILGKILIIFIGLTKLVEQSETIGERKPAQRAWNSIIPNCELVKPSDTQIRIPVKYVSRSQSALKKL